MKNKTKNFTIIIAFVAIISIAFLSYAHSAYAVGTCTSQEEMDCSDLGQTCLNGQCVAITPTATITTVANPTSPPGTVNIQSPFGGLGVDSIIHNTFNRAMVLILFVIGLVLFALLIYAGFLYMIDAGNEENAKKAKQIMTSAIIGIAIIAIVGALLRFIEAIFGITF